MELNEVNIGHLRFKYFSSSRELMDLIETHYEIKENLCIMACDARSFHLSKSNVQLNQAYNDKETVLLTDGRPLFWIQESKVRNTKHLTGPGVMKLILESELKHKRHFIIGGPDYKLISYISFLKELKINITGYYTPPFTNVDLWDVDDIAIKISNANADFIWVATGAPKQEILINRVKAKTKGVYFGVGLGLDYFCGAVKTPPLLVSRYGMEWFWRYSQQLDKLARFVVPFLRMLQLLWIELIYKRIRYKLSYRF